MFGCEHGCPSFWWIGPIFLFILIIGCIFIMRGCSCMSGWHFPGGRTRRFTDKSATEILDKRYALGEIDRKEYEEMKNLILQGEKKGS